MEIDIIYCGGGSAQYAKIALDAGMHYGARMPSTVYYSPWFIDQDWSDPNRDVYMACLNDHRPACATVLDWERIDQFDEVMSWAEEAAQYVGQRVIIIPKVSATINKIPDTIGGKEVVLGYSVPTQYGGTDVPLTEFGRRPVHLLGGSPQRQLSLAHYLNVVSADGNYSAKLAMNGQFWVNGDAHYAANRYFPTIVEADGVEWPEDGMPYEAFRRSCVNIMSAWNDFANGKDMRIEPRSPGSPRAKYRTRRNTTKRVLDYITEFAIENGYLPTYRNIAASLEVALSVVSYNITQLEKAGAIERIDGAKAYRVTDLVYVRKEK